MSSIVGKSLDDILSINPIGPLSTAIGNNFYGINHRQISTPIPSNKEHYGLTLFVRPQLNMQSENLRNVRIFTPLLTKDFNSIQTITRVTLDPRLHYNYPSGDSAIDTVLVDKYQSFIPFLTNHLKTLSGWPDLVVPTYTSKEGAYQEAQSIADGITKNFTAYDITATFRNSKGDPVTSLFYHWEHYQSHVFEGTLVPYADMIANNEIDYNTKIYRLVLDQTKKYLIKIAATIAFPTSLPTGAYMDYNIEKPYNDQNDDITVRFKCNGFEFNDDILIKELNECVGYFNPSMRPEYLESRMIQIPDELLHIFNNRGYLRIDPVTYEVQWWADKDFYRRKINGLNASDLANLF
jgi:hypothetical protein